MSQELDNARFRADGAEEEMIRQGAEIVRLRGLIQKLVTGARQMQKGFGPCMGCQELRCDITGCYVAEAEEFLDGK